ncbi:MAG: hypothetical protein ABUS51_05955 [Acidobacteriota bacterium]
MDTLWWVVAARAGLAVRKETISELLKRLKTPGGAGIGNSRGQCPYSRAR